MTSASTAFTSEAECVSYAAMGSVLTPRPPASLVFSIGPCAPVSGGVLACVLSIIGSGLLPGAPIVVCSPTATPNCSQIDAAAAVDDDRTIPDFYGSYQSGCLAGDLYSVRTTTAAGTPIESSATCSL